MNSKYLKLCTLLGLVLAFEFACGQDSIPPNTRTPEEMAIPPAGEVQRLWLKEAASLKAELTTVLVNVPPGSEGQGSTEYAKFQTFNTGIATVISSRLQADVFSLIPQYEELLAFSPYSEEDTDAPAFAKECSRLIRCRLPMLFANAMERRIIDQNAAVPVAEVEKFVIFFSTKGFIGDMEHQPDIDEAGVIILNPAAVVTKLKSLPVGPATIFLRGFTAVEAFACYEAGGDRMPALKTKYAANKTEIIAKWNELALWVSGQLSNGFLISPQPQP